METFNIMAFLLRYMFPNCILFRFFEQPQISLPSGARIDDRPNYPTTEEALEDLWDEIRETFTKQTLNIW